MTELTNKEMQAVELEILKVLSNICEEQGLDYFIMYGTLLGAVRHKGFIPWDDDLDIMMKRADYDKLVQYLIEHEEELMPYKLFSPYNNPEYPFMIGRFCDTRYKYEGNNEIDCGMGIFVDIYPLDGCGKSMKEVNLKGNYFRYLSSMCFLASRKHFFVDHELYSSKKDIKMTIIKVPLFVIAKTLGIKHYLKKLEKLISKYRYEDNEYVGPTTWMSNYKKDIMKKEWVDETVFIDFEGEKFRAPKEYEKILKHKYGDYMKMPPKEKQVATHDYKAYKK